METSQSKVIIIPARFSGRQRKEIGSAIIEHIVKRTQSGLDVNNTFFAAYSKGYDKSGTPDLTVSEQMLNSLELLSHGPGFVKIGFANTKANDKASWVQDPKGQKSGSPARRFVGISQEDLDAILERF